MVQTGIVLSTKHNECDVLMHPRKPAQCKPLSSQHSSTLATGLGSTWAPMGTTRGRPSVAAARTTACRPIPGTTISRRTLAGRARKTSSTAMRRTTYDASHTPSRNPWTFSIGASHFTRRMRTPGPSTCSRTVTNTGRSHPAALRLNTSTSASTPTKLRKSCFALRTLSGTRTSG